ncbi:MAG TPA: hypothetical protein VML58_14210 [Burkholderiaceae bacterium]|nr:hypothetical protein [Burkholderiaceae bacterium]
MSSTEEETSTPPAKPPQAPAPPDPVADAQRRERFMQVAGPGQLHAAALALLVSPGRAREMAVWRDECRHTVGAKELRNDLMKVHWPERLPWLERFVGRIAQGPLDKRQQLLRAVRRLIAADGRALALDRLRWLAIRHTLGDVKALARPAAAEVELEGLATETALQIARFSAFLSRIVPSPEIDIDVVSGAATSGERWWRDVMQPWPDAGATRDMPDANALVNALHDVQALPWMLRPVLVRRWVDAAVTLSPAGQLAAPAAEALRIAARLLDSPLPPAVAACFVEVPGA